MGVVYGGGRGSRGGGGRDGREEEQGRRKSLGLWRYGLNVYICLPLPPQHPRQKFICGILPSGWLLEGVGPLRGDLVMRVEPSYKRDPRELLLPFLPVRPGLEDGHVSESLLSPVAESAGSWILDFPASRPARKFCHFSHPVCGYLLQQHEIPKTSKDGVLGQDP